MSIEDTANCAAGNEIAERAKFAAVTFPMLRSGARARTKEMGLKGAEGWPIAYRHVFDALHRQRSYVGHSPQDGSELRAVAHLTITNHHSTMG
jgi:hypothetical protein